LRLAVEHVTSREQFGHPLGVLQAVKHRMADVEVACAATETALSRCADATSEDRAEIELTILVARIQAGRAAVAASVQAQQVLGGMGFSWEHPLHRYVRRARVLEVPGGSTGDALSDLAKKLASNGEAPLLGYV